MNTHIFFCCPFIKKSVSKMFKVTEFPGDFILNVCTAAKWTGENYSKVSLIKYFDIDLSELNMICSRILWDLLGQSRSYPVTALQAASSSGRAATLPL